MTIFSDPTPGMYDPTRKQWLPLNAPTPLPREHTQLSIATLNVWFAAHYFEERCEATLSLLAKQQPDVICLQEVTPDFVSRLLETEWVRADYQVSDIYSGSVDPYGVLILSHIPLGNWHFLRLPSAMGRHLLAAEAALNGAATTIATVHLESRDYAAPTRAKQLARIFPYLAPSKHAVVTGDFNLCSSWEENRRLDPTYQDVWPALRANDPGFTIDTEVNVMRLQASSKQKQVRFDRVLLRSARPGWQAKSIELLGTRPISESLPHVFPSDHFGLLATFSWQG